MLWSDSRVSGHPGTSTLPYRMPMRSSVTRLAARPPRGPFPAWTYG